MYNVTENLAKFLYLNLLVLGISLLIVEVSVHSVQFSHSVVFDSLRPRGLHLVKPPCPSPILGACSNSCPWDGDAIWPSQPVVCFSFHLQSYPESLSFQMSLFFTSGGQSIEVSDSVLPMNIQDLFPLGWTGWISLQSKRLSRVFSITRVQKHKLFGAQLSLYSNSHIHTWPLEKP